MSQVPPPTSASVPLLEMQGVSQIFGNPEKGGTIALNDMTFTIPADKPIFTSLVGAPFLVRVIRRAQASWLAT